jgi:hypothetical protein
MSYFWLLVFDSIKLLDLPKANYKSDEKQKQTRLKSWLAYEKNPYLTH